MNITVQDLLELPFIHEAGLHELGASHTFRDASTDSRTLKFGDLFIALTGPNFDGHEYLEQVAKEGALAAIVSERWFTQHKSKHLILPMLVVQSPMDAFGELAAIYRRKFDIPVLVIAGSNGKTTTKELIGHVLSQELDVLKNEANFNNQIGVPHTIFRLREGHQIAVIEIGTNHPGEIAWLCKVAQPTHALITNIGREHLEFFKDLSGVAREEKAAFDYVWEHSGSVFVNMDDAHLRMAAKQFGDRAITYSGLEGAAHSDVAAHRIGYAKDGRLELRVECNRKSFKVRTHLVADYAPNMIAAASAVAFHFEIRRSELKSQIENFRPHDKRLEVSHLNGITILNDAYNANPDSMLSAVQTLTNFPSSGRRIAVLGDMFELGEASAREHRALGRKIAEFPIDHFLFTGKDMQLAWKAYRTARANGDGLHDSYFATKVDLVKSLRDLLREGDTVLLKGSRGMKMEEVLDLLQKM